MSLQAATARQVQAADPAGSTWLSANAGSGKTRVLIDRVARLLLDGVNPQHVLCLTYTKAAASEMQNRLFERLGGWALMRDETLRSTLGALGVTDALDGEALAKARRLFARAIETPGGLRIQTIHSFCAALLRRFPLEAGVSPQFIEMDDRTAEMLRADVVDALALGPDAARVDALAAQYTGEDFARLTGQIATRREEFGQAVDLAEVLRWFGLPPGADADSVLRIAFDGSEAGLMARMLPLLASQSASYARAGEALGALDWRAPGQAAFEVLADLFLYSSGDQRHQPKTGKWPQPRHGARVALDPVLPDLDALMGRVADARQAQLGLAAAHRALALHRFADAFLAGYAREKDRRGWVDFDDLIHKTRALLTDSAVAAWVLYRLDGGIDHILVDEAQDTSPAQWQVIERLAQEMASGEGAREARLRTIFVVGDRKQSIYSFQGADPAEFDRMRTYFETQLQSGPGLSTLMLEFSFRSAATVLEAVDATLAAAGPIGADMAEAQHRAIHAERPGRVDLWPTVEPPEKEEDGVWYDPVDHMARNHPTVVLAESIASQIADMLETETLPQDDGTRRPVRAGDIMILVQRRSPLFHEIIRACKARGLPVAGADRLKLGGELAVKDLSALLSFLATPEDDLSLAAALRSPLFGWSEDALYRLAQGRSGYLWTALRAAEATHPETLAVLHALRDDADYLRPYDLIDRILTRHDGRLNLLARLGPEAEDGIDALLAQALGYERMEIPSLTGFLAWLQTDDIEIKRQLDGAGDRLRVMTVHGAKGLESPIVILPDTGERKRDVKDDILRLQDGPVWKPSADQQPDILRAALEQARLRQDEERLRLLYVAMTRAETWLIVCVAGNAGKPGESWYRLVEQGLIDCAALDFGFPLGPGLRLARGDWAGGKATQIAGAGGAAGAPLPDWASARAAPPPRAIKTRSPSGLGGEKVLPGEAISPDDPTGEVALKRGRQIHLLLEHLPTVPRGTWRDLARDLLSIGDDSEPPDIADALMTDAARVLDDPALGQMFGQAALSEVAVTATLPELGGARLHGAIDRLILEPHRVLAVDYKTNRMVPDRAQDVPEGLLRQMGAYHAALAQIYPDRQVEVAILWTAVPRLMPLPHDMVRAALARAATS